MLDLSRVPVEILLRNRGKQGERIRIGNNSCIINPNSQIKIRVDNSFDVVGYLAQANDNLLIAEINEMKDNLNSTIVYINQTFNEDGSSNLDMSYENNGGEKYIIVQLDDGKIFLTNSEVL